MPKQVVLTSAEYKEYMRTGKMPKRAESGDSIFGQGDTGERPGPPIKATAKVQESADEPRMNKTEARYARRLEDDPDVAIFEFERVRLRLAHNAFYNPDFLVIKKDGSVELHEVKGGYIREDGMLKARTAAEMYPYFVFKMFQWKKGEWNELTIA